MQVDCDADMTWQEYAGAREECTTNDDDIVHAIAGGTHATMCADASGLPAFFRWNAGLPLGDDGLADAIGSHSSNVCDSDNVTDGRVDVAHQTADEEAAEKEEDEMDAEMTTLDVPAIEICPDLLDKWRKQQLDAELSAERRRRNQDPERATKRKRCESCNRKLHVAADPCRCEGYFCGDHRTGSGEQHTCSFDRRANERARIVRDNPETRKRKLEKL